MGFGGFGEAFDNFADSRVLQGFQSNVNGLQSLQDGKDALFQSVLYCGGGSGGSGGSGRGSGMWR